MSEESPLWEHSVARASCVALFARMGSLWAGYGGRGTQAFPPFAKRPDAGPRRRSLWQKDIS